MPERKKRVWLWVLLIIVIVVVAIVVGTSRYESDNIIRSVQRMKKPGADTTLKAAWDGYLQNAKWSRQDADGKTFVSVSGVLMYAGRAAEAVVQYEVEQQTISENDYIVATPYAFEVDGEAKSMFELWMLLSDVFGE